MFLTKLEKVVILLLRVEEIRSKTLFGFYKNYDIGENKIRKLHDKIIKLGGNINTKIKIE